MAWKKKKTFETCIFLYNLRCLSFDSRMWRLAPVTDSGAFWVVSPVVECSFSIAYNDPISSKIEDDINFKASKHRIWKVCLWNSGFIKKIWEGKLLILLI